MPEGFGNGRGDNGIKLPRLSPLDGRLQIGKTGISRRRCSLSGSGGVGVNINEVDGVGIFERLTAIAPTGHLANPPQSPIGVVQHPTTPHHGYLRTGTMRVCQGFEDDFRANSSRIAKGEGQTGG